MNGLGIIILTGGSSSRLGSAKQALQYEGKSLMQNTIDKAIELTAVKKLVVTGAYGDQYTNQIPPDFDIVHNANYTFGMSSSLKTGLQTLVKDKSIKSVLVMLVDQPLVPLSHYQNLCNALESNEGIIATQFGKLETGHFGAPTIFTRKHFEALLNLSNHEGAKAIIKKHINHVRFVECNEAAFDIDTPEDYELLQDIEKKDLEP